VVTDQVLVENQALAENQVLVETDLETTNQVLVENQALVENQVLVEIVTVDHQIDVVTAIDLEIIDLETDKNINKMNLIVHFFY
jgi:hypothetical protein